MLSTSPGKTKMTAYGPDGEPGVTLLEGAAEVGRTEVEVGGGTVGEAASTGGEVGEGGAGDGGRDVGAGSAGSVAVASGFVMNEIPQPRETIVSATSKGTRVDLLLNILHLIVYEYNALHTSL
jgi:hypothetical protein